MAYRLKAVNSCFLAFGLAVFVTVPNEIGRQDISSLIPSDMKLTSFM